MIDKWMAVACSAGFVMAGSACGQIEVILSEVPGHPTSQVVGARDQLGNPITVRYKTMEDLAISPDGSRWIVKTRTNGISAEDDVLIMGSGTNGSVFAQAGQPIFGMTGERFDFFDSFPTVGFNSAGEFAFSARGTGSSATNEKILKFQGGVLSQVAQRGDATTGLLDEFNLPDPDATLGNSLNHVNLLDSGSVAFLAQTLDNIHSSRRPAVLLDSGAFLQSGVSLVNSLLVPWTGISSFHITPDGQNWLARGQTGDILQGTRLRHLAVNNDIVIREGDSLGGGAILVAEVFEAKLLADGTWFARGDDPADNDWAVRNGALVAATFDPITPSASETWGVSILDVIGNRNGDFVVIGNTTNADVAANEVAVLNGTRVVVREGDPVDLNGNGLPDDDAFIGDGTPTSVAFLTNDAFLTDDGWLYFFANLRDAAGNDLGDSFGGGGAALLRIRVIGGACPCEFDGAPGVNVFDLLAYLDLWFIGDPGADIDGTPGVDVFDLLTFLDCWFPASAGAPCP